MLFAQDRLLLICLVFLLLRQNLNLLLGAPFFCLTILGMRAEIVRYLAEDSLELDIWLILLLVRFFFFYLCGAFIYWLVSVEKVFGGFCGLSVDIGVNFSSLTKLAIVGHKLTTCLVVQR